MPAASSPFSRIVAARRALGGRAAEAFFEGISASCKTLPKARRALAELEILRDVPYGPLPAHRLDVYRPARSLDGPAPTVLYIHGGGFRILSKETHWLMGIAFARMGAVVFSIDYRLAPRHPFPAAAQDACLAARWVHENAAAYGADPARLVVAGESAGANLTCVVGIASAWRRPEPWARAVFDAGVRPQALMPACGMLQVSDVDRIKRRRPDIGRFVHDRLREVGNGYLPGGAPEPLADPICVLEGPAQPERPLAPMFIPCGTRDPLIEDSRRLAAACAQRGVEHTLRIYPGGIHAFHAFVWRPAAKQCWADHRAFFARHVT